MQEKMFGRDGWLHNAYIMSSSILKKILLNILCPAVILFILTSLGIVLDLTYQGRFKIKGCVELLEYIKNSLKFSGLSHAELWSFITGNIGVLISLVSIFFTFTIEIFERSEKKSFGISQKELIYEKSERLYSLLNEMTALLPLFMLLYIVFGFCAASYLLLFWSYIFLLLIYNRQRRSYDEERLMDALCMKLLEPFQNANCIQDVVELYKYQNYLTDIYAYTKKEDDWIHVETFGRRFLEEIQKFEDDICFAAEYYFITTVFGQKNKEKKFDFFEIIKRYMEEMEYDSNFDYADHKAVILLWGMLVASIPYAEENELIKFLRFFSDFKGRSCRKIRNMKMEISDQICMKESGMLLILLEVWLDNHCSEEKELAVLTEKVYRNGIDAFADDGVVSQYDFLSLYENIADNYVNVSKLIERFIKERSTGVKMSNVANIIENL